MSQDLGRVDLVNTDYNNSNHKISPGEVIGVALNLFNDANTPMGGVHTLANDWDHVKVENGQTKMCNTFEDGWPAPSDGGALPDILPISEGDCGYITRENGQQITRNEPNETIAPICFLLYRDENETHWVDQQTYMERVGGNLSDCLRDDEPLACYFRVIPGADQAWYSKLDPNKQLARLPTPKSTFFSEEGNSFLFEGFQYLCYLKSIANLSHGNRSQLPLAGPLYQLR